MKQQFGDFLWSSRYESIYLVYGVGIVVHRQTQLVQRGGDLFRVLKPTDLPLTLSGDWAIDSPKLSIVGDAILRQSLAGPDGSKQVGFGSSTVEGELFSINNRLTRTGIYPGQRFATYQGGQLASLLRALTDPFVQFLAICFLGDSKTWGMTASGIAPVEPRGGLLTDARNNGSSATWVNLLHKWLGAEFYDSAAVQEAIWPGTPNGVAQFTYVKSVDLFPGITPFAQIGSFAEQVDTSATLGVMWYVNMSVSGGGPHSFSWVMTGNSFDLRFAATPEGAEYRVFIDGVQQGTTFKTSSTDLGLPGPVYGQSRTHNFSFRKNASIRVEAVGGNLSRTTLRIESVRFNRTLRVTNNGIVGIDSERYRTVLLQDALRYDDMFCGIQLGTNNRGMPPSLGAPTSPSTLSKSLGLMMDHVIAKGVTPIMLCANEVADNAPPTYHYSMNQVRSVIADLAASKRVDFVDQYALTKRLQSAGVSYLADALHPNDLGHYLLFENLRNAISSAVSA